MARITIVGGYYGTGKTEFAVSLALSLAKSQSLPVTLVDLDVVNPYFRSREVRPLLEAAGVEVIGNSLGIDKGVDIPAIPASVTAPLKNNQRCAVVDLGGDPAGARAMRQFRAQIPTEDAEFLYVVNVFRSENRSAEAALDSLRSIEAALSLRVTGLVNNTHLLDETTLEHVLLGDEVCREIGSLSDELPTRYVSALPEILQQLPHRVMGTRFAIGQYLREEWMHGGNTHLPPRQIV